MTTHLTPKHLDQPGLVADLYHLTMAYGLWQQEKSETRGVYHLFYRKAPFQNEFALAAGLDLVIDYLNQWHFSASAIQYLGRLRGQDSQPLFPVAFLNYLQRLRFTGDVYAIPEGTAVFPHQPLIRVEAPLAQGMLIESALLNLINFSTLIATKANRIVRAATGDPVLEFGLRRAQGLDGALTASRSAYIGGCHATSHLLAGFYYGIPTKGTHAHSWVMCFDSEMEAFEAYAAALPNNCIFLVDTYDTLTGVDKAIMMGRHLRQRGYELNGIRLDSGDLVALSQEARRKLDDAGFPKARIVASDGLDEQRITQLKAQGAAIDTWGVGTRLVTGKDDPALGGVYKLGALQREDQSWTSVIKTSDTPVKTSNPGILDVLRYRDADGQPVADQITNTLSPPSHQWTDHEGNNQLSLQELKGESLLVPVFQNGEQVYQSPSISAIRKKAMEQGSFFAERPYPNGLELGLFKQKKELSGKYQSIS